MPDDISTIGPAAEYPTLPLWLAGEVTGRDLVATTTRVIGRVVSDTAIAASFTITGAAAVNVSYYVIIESLNNSRLYASASTFGNLFVIDEDYTRFRSLELDGNNLVGGFEHARGLSSFGNEVYIYLNKIYDIGRNNQAATGLWNAANPEMICNNLIYRIRANYAGTASGAWAMGFTDQSSGASDYAFCNTIDEVTNLSTNVTAQSYGYHHADNNLKKIAGNIGTRVTTSAGGTAKVFFIDVPLLADMRYNTSDDPTASGVGSNINIPAGNIFTNHLIRDYTEKASAITVNGFVPDPSAIWIPPDPDYDGWNTDLNGVARPQGGIYDQGAYELVGGAGGGFMGLRMPPRRERTRILQGRS